MWFIILIHFTSTFVQDFYLFIENNYENIIYKKNEYDMYEIYDFELKESLYHKYHIVINTETNNLLFMHCDKVQKTYPLDNLILKALLTHFDKTYSDGKNPYRRKRKKQS